MTLFCKNHAKIQKNQKDFGETYIFQQVTTIKTSKMVEINFRSRISLNIFRQGVMMNCMNIFYWFS